MKLRILKITLAAGILFLSVPSGLIAQELKGKIIDAETGEPIPLATVILDTDNYQAASSQGYFEFTPLDTGKHSLKVISLGYKDFDTVFTFPAISSVNILLQPAETLLDQAVVSASKFSQNINEVTVSLDVIEPNLINEKNQVNLDDVLQQAPGLNITENQANIRGGSGWSYGTGTRVQFLVDDIPLIAADAGQAQWDLVPIHSVQHIEVLKGASSVLYGSAALNGVINVFTPVKVEKRKIQVNSYFGWYDAPERESLKWWDGLQSNSGVNFQYEEKLTDLSGFITSGGYFNDEGFRYLEGEERGRLFFSYYTRPKNLKNLRFSLSGNFTYSEQGDALIWESDSLAYIPQDSVATQTTGLDFYIDPSVEFRHGPFRHSFKSRYLRINNNAVSQQQDYTNSSDWYYATYMLQYFWKEMINTAFGFAASYTESESVIFQGDHFSSSSAAFLQLDAKPLDWVNFSAGARYENFTLDDRFAARPVYRAGLNLKVFPATSVRASYGEAFRFPAIVEAFTETRIGLISVFPNPDLQPETGSSYEVGVRQLFSYKKWKGYADAAYFHMAYDNMIEYNFAPWRPPRGFDDIGFGFLPINIGATTIEGAEITLFAEGLLGNVSTRIIAGYTYTLPRIVNPSEVYAFAQGFPVTYDSSSTDISGNILKYRYRHLFKWDSQFNYKEFGWGFSIRYNDFMQNIDRIFEESVIDGVAEARSRYLNGDLLVDLRISYRLNQHFEISLLSENVFNREVMIRPAYLGPPRSYAVRLQYQN